MGISNLRLIYSHIRSDRNQLFLDPPEDKKTTRKAKI